MSAPAHHDVYHVLLATVAQVEGLAGRIGHRVVAPEGLCGPLFHLAAGHDFTMLFEMAQGKDLSLIGFYFAGALLQVNKLTRLPDMRNPLELSTLQAFFTSLVNDILDRLNPSDLPPWAPGAP